MKTKKLKPIATLTFMFCMLCTVAFGQAKFEKVKTENYSIMDLAEMDDNYSTFVDMVERSGLDVSTEFAESVTAFIPPNEAFEEMSVERMKELKDPKNKAELIKFVRYHFLPTEVTSDEFESTQVITTSNDEEISIDADRIGDELIYIGGAQVTQADIQASNGIVHLVDSVIEPDGGRVYR